MKQSQGLPGWVTYMLVPQVEETVRWVAFQGKGFTFKTAKKRFMPKETVEGEELAKEIAPFILKKIDKKKIPLMINLLKTIKENKKLKIKV